MKKIDLGQTITILANMGVIAGIAFLAFELSQNNELLQLQVESARNERSNGVVELVVNNPEYTELMLKDSDELSEYERGRLVVLGMGVLLNAEAVFRDAQGGRVAESDAIRAVRSVWHREYLNYGAPLAWDTFKERATPDFVEWMETYVIPEEPGSFGGE